MREETFYGSAESNVESLDLLLKHAVSFCSDLEVSFPLTVKHSKEGPFVPAHIPCLAHNAVFVVFTVVGLERDGVNNTAFLDHARGRARFQKLGSEFVGEWYVGTCRDTTGCLELGDGGR